MEHLLAVGTYVSSHIGGVIGAVVASFVVGFLWHGPLFGKTWMKFNKIPEPKPGDVSFSMMLPGISASVLMALVQSAVMGRTFQIVSLTGVGQALIIATILWLPFTALVLANEYAWAGKSFKHIAFDAAYNLASMWTIAAVLFYTL